jgi:hypothetical protein
VVTFFQILGNLNSCVNPWIYILFNRQQTRRAFTPCCCWWWWCFCGGSKGKKSFFEFNFKNYSIFDD